MTGDVAVNDELTPNWLGGWQDYEGDAITFLVDSGPSHGALSLDPTTGQYTYQPDSLYVGTDSFTYRLSDSNLTSVYAATVSLGIFNSVPDPQDDSYVILMNGEMEGNVSDNDYLTPDGTGGWKDYEDDQIFFQLIDSPDSGEFEFNAATGWFSYSPDDGSMDPTTFQYQLWDGVASSAYIATVTINVYLPFNAVDDASFTYTDTTTGIAYPDVNYFVLKGNTLSISAEQGVLKNDAALEFVPYLTAVQQGNGQYGTFAIAASGAFTYTPYSWVFDSPLFTYMGLEDTCQYAAMDPAGNTSSATVTVDLVELYIMRNLMDVDTPAAQQPRDFKTPWVGEKIALSVGVKGKATLQGATFQWSVDSGAIENYVHVEAPMGQPSLGHGEVIPLSADELKTQSPSFYWFTGGVKLVDVSVTAAGQVGQDLALFTVQRPKNHITSVTTSVNLFQSDDKVKVQFGVLDANGNLVAGQPGIKFSQTRDPEAEQAGTFRWAQTISAFYQQSHTGFYLHASPNGLDHEFEYEVAGSGLGTDDSPNLNFIPGLNWASGCFSADMYLMFKSFRPDSIYVPVEDVQWVFSWYAEKDATGMWSLVNRNWSQDPEGVDSVYFPTWTNVLVNGPLIWTEEPPWP